jgi:hypothetical protein
LTPLTSDSKEIVRFIQDSISARPSLVLFEQAEGIESRVRMHASDGRPHLYRILGGGQGTGCYLCSRQFGIQLIELWTRVTKRHIDYSWQQLWESNDVYFQRCWVESSAAPVRLGLYPFNVRSRHKQATMLLKAIPSNHTSDVIVVHRNMVCDFIRIKKNESIMQ